MTLSWQYLIDIDDFLKENLTDENDILLAYNYGRMMEIEKLQREKRNFTYLARGDIDSKSNHISVIDSYNFDKGLNTIDIIEPDFGKVMNISLYSVCGFIHPDNDLEFELYLIEKFK